MPRSLPPVASLLALLALLALAACPTKREDGSAQTPESKAEDDAGPVAQLPSLEAPDEDEEAAHHVVFADRTSQTYLLLLPGEPGPAPTREELAAEVRKALEGAEDEPEVELLLQLIASEPAPPATAPDLTPEERESIRHRDLLGLHVDLLPLAEQGQDALIPLEVLRDPISTRALSDEERASLPARRWVLVLQAHYRNRYALRGLRLLQTLVRIAARDRGALIHDPDTGETVGVDVFSERRLQSTVGNVADQVIVVPFPDPRHGEGFVRLATRGMRRFGAVDLELDGLPADPRILEAATHLVYGVAYRMVRDGEYDQEGFAVEADDVIELQRLDVERAYAGREGRVPRCEGCPQRTRLHLVERPEEDHDPVDHVVARIVAPRKESDAPGYDQPEWVLQALSDLLGVP
ncbi:MAG: hypothetical protein H6712_33890 [Myxococcales bacterium]|nr:hypothetical protein [Myxococcales bacterium]MCB9718885.1 hypothetical protein [Myxococcales bacterium]